MYAKRHPKPDTIFKPRDKVLLKNLRRNNKKGVWSLMPWIGPFAIESLSDKTLVPLEKATEL